MTPHLSSPTVDCGARVVEHSLVTRVDCRRDADKSCAHCSVTVTPIRP